MSRIYKGVVELVGNTSLVEVVNIEQQEKLKVTLLIKLEYLNPTGSVKSQVGKVMIRNAEQRGTLKLGSVIIEPASGNTGIGLASIAVAGGYRMILTMPNTMSIKRRNILKAYGAEIVLTPRELGTTGTVEKAKELAKGIPGSSIPGQFVNPVNPKAHMETTGPEIWRDTQRKVDLFVASVGTGDTITGTRTHLRRKNPDPKVTAVEPAASTVLSGKTANPHEIQGIGAGFVPEILGTGIYNETITVDNDVPFAASKMLVRIEGLLTGISSSVVLYAAIQAAKRPENKGKAIVALLPDSGDRYYPTPLSVE